MAKTVPARGLSANDSSAKGTVEQIFTKDGKSYRYMKVKDIAVAANNVVEYSTTESAVTLDRAGGSSIGRHVAGVAVATVTAGNYGWVQIDGRVTATVPAGVAIAAGDLVAPHSTSNGGIIAATTSTFKQSFAVALGADTATTSAAGTASIQLFRV